MSVKDKLEIFLITYNRKAKLKHTLDTILAENSPIKDFSITVLDNVSTDGSKELLEEYVQKYPNLIYVRHKRNIGGDANYVRAIELASREYVWVLCDDDKYDFSNWSEVEKSIDEGADIITVADYVFPSKKSKKNVAYQIFQLTFVPAAILKTSWITDSVLTAMFNCIYAMFPQVCPVIKVVNEKGNIHVLSKPIVFNGLHFDDKVEDFSYCRGINDDFYTERKQKTTWALGYSNIVTLLKDVELRKKAMLVGLLYKDIYASKEILQASLIESYIRTGDINYFYEIYKVLPESLRSLFEPYATNFKQYLKGNKKISLAQKIFSVKNESGHKVVRTLGIKMKFRRRKK